MTSAETENRKSMALAPRRAVVEVAEWPLTHADYEEIKAALTSWRDILLCKLLRATGLRIAEALDLTPEMVDREGPDAFVWVQRRKKRREQWERVYLPPQLGVELREYIRGNHIPPGQRVFPITDRQVRNVFYRAGLRAMGRRVHPHEFRGLYIKTLLDGGIPVPAAAKMVGHTDSRTTERWYYELSRDQRREVQRRIPV